MDIVDLNIPGDRDIKKEIEDFVLEKGYEEVLILGAVGSVKDMEFTTPIYDELPLRTKKTLINGAGELLSFTGEIMKREFMDPELRTIYKDTSSPLFIHIHASVAAKNGLVAGGGMAGGRTFRGIRVFLAPRTRV